MPDVLGAQVQFFFDNPNAPIPHIRAGKLKPLVITGPKRSPALPDVPTATEAGLKDFVTANWFGLFAPAKTPPEILDRLHQETARILKRPEIIERFARDAVDVGDLSRAEYAAFIRGEIGKWAKIIRERGIKPE